jgi:ABC-type multidrug transport system ATPase subunit
MLTSETIRWRSLSRLEIMSEAVGIQGLTKDFGKVRALDGLELSVEAGEVHGFLGPNGSGKTTTLRILLGLIRPTPGGCGCWGAMPGRMPSGCTGVWPTFPGM